jgi:putative phosphoesterase
MRIAVLSDTHDNLPALERAVALLGEVRPALVLHAGDFISPFTARVLRPLSEHGIEFAGIFGNNDGERFGLRAAYGDIGPIHEDPHGFEVAGRRVLMTHREVLVDALAESGRYDIVVYGHTHRVDVRTSTCLVLNPGEACGWLTGRCTLAILDPEAMSAEIVEF